MPSRRRHHCGDWSNLCYKDKRANEDALVYGLRILSHCTLGKGKHHDIITEAAPL